MIWVYVIFGVVAFLFTAGNCYEDTGDGLWAVFMGALAAVAASLFLWGLSSLIEADERAMATDYETTYVLHEMQLANESEKHSSGTFFLIAGGTSSSFTKHGYYYFYAEAPTGKITVGKMRIEDAIIQQDSDRAALVCKTHTKGQTFDSDELDRHIEGCIFHVPEGSIGDKINIKLKGNV